MFTGIVQGKGRITAVETLPGGRRLEIDLGPLAAGAALGASVCVSGACLTVVRVDGSRAIFDLSTETLERTWFASIEVGREVNLERSLQVGDELGGHFVTGHVDGIGTAREIVPEGEFATHWYEAPPILRPLLVPKGSVTVEGVSLTVAELGEAGRFSVALIPETLERTTLASLAPGAAVHLEGDLIGKHVARFLAARETAL